MATGLKVYNAAGQVAFDTSRLGGVLLDSFVAALSSNTTYTYTYTIPSGSDVKVFVSRNDAFYRSDLFTVTKTISGTTATITLNPGNVGVATITVNIVLLLT
jgi:ribosomal protein S8E